MAILRAFKAIRPTKELAKDVAALPYDVMDSDEAREMVKDKPYSFLHVDKAEVDLPVDIDVYDSRVYEKARENLNSMIEKGILIKDKNPSLYIYRQVMNDHPQTGIVGCVSIDEYEKNKIKKHEFTRPEKEQDRINHVENCNANTGPIFLSYNGKSDINALIDMWTKKQPEYDFVSEDGIQHVVWVIDNEEVIAEIINKFKSVENFYIADGHHRAASAVKVGLKKRLENPDYTGNEEFNFFLGVLFPAEQLHILDYNRVVKDLNGYSEEEIINKVSEAFEVVPCENHGSYKPQNKHQFGMYLNKKWYALKAKGGSFDESNPIESLDVAILQNNLLSPILDIGDPRTDKRIDFIGGIRGMKELERRANSDMKIAFSMYPTTMQDIIDVADMGKVMPPKSTWFEPKLRSGLFIHELE